MISFDNFFSAFNKLELIFVFRFALFFVVVDVDERHFDVPNGVQESAEVRVRHHRKTGDQARRELVQEVLRLDPRDRSNWTWRRVRRFVFGCRVLLLHFFLVLEGDLREVVLSHSADEGDEVGARFQVVLKTRIGKRSFQDRSLEKNQKFYILKSQDLFHFLSIRQLL